MCDVRNVKRFNFDINVRIQISTEYVLPIFNFNSIFLRSNLYEELINISFKLNFVTLFENGNINWKYINVVN